MSSNDSQRFATDPHASSSFITEQMHSLRNVPPRSEESWEKIHDAVFKRLDTEEKISIFLSLSTRIANLIDTMAGILLEKKIWVPAAAFALFCIIVTGTLFLQVKQIPERHSSSEAGQIQPEPIDASLILASGSVHFSNPDSLQPNQISGFPGSLRTGSIVHTGDSARAVILFRDGSTVALLPRTKLQVRQLTGAVTSLDISVGTICAQVQKSGTRKSFSVGSPAGKCEVLGTRFTVSVYGENDHEPERTEFSVLQGKVEVFAPTRGRSPVYLSDGQTINVKLSGDDPVAAKSIGNIDAFTSLFDLIDNSIVVDPCTTRCGLLRITSRPADARILTNGIVWGQTPMFAAVPAGIYKISVSKPGFLDSHDTVEINTSRDVHLAVVLNELPARRAAADEPLAVGDDMFEQPIHSPAREDLVGLELLTSGQRLLKEGKFGEAVEVFELLLYRDSTDESLRTTALVKAFQASQRQRKYKQALRYANQIIVPGTNKNIRELVLFDRACLKATYLSDPEGAIEDLAAYVAEYPDGVLAKEAIRKIATQVMQDSGQTKMMRLFRKSLDRLARDTRNSPRSLLILGTCYEEEFSSCELALACYDRIVRTAPDSDSGEAALFKYAGCLRKNGNSVQASRAFELYRRRYPNGKWIKKAGHAAVNVH